MSIELQGTCKQNACPVATLGECLDGHDTPSDCEYFLPEAIGESEEDDLDVDATDEDDDLNVETTDEDDEEYEEDLTGVVQFSEIELQGDAVDEVLAASPTKVIIIAGSPDSGKTTLVATLIDQFHQGEYAEYLFHASKTLGGLEKRCFDARLASGRSQATTKRTLLEETIRFLHLVVRPTDLSPPCPLLFADISGELFEQMQIHLEEVRRQLFLRRSDHFVLLFDAKRLVNDVMRQEEKTSGLSLMRSLVQEGMLDKNTCVEVVFSRWDFAADSSAQEVVRGFANGIRHSFERAFQSSVGTLAFFEVAARPAPGSSLPTAYGLEPLFRTWLEAPLNNTDDPQIAHLPPAAMKEYVAMRQANSPESAS